MLKYFRARKADKARVQMLNQLSSRGEVAYQMDAVEAAIKTHEEDNIVPRDMSDVKAQLQGLRNSTAILDDIVDVWSRM